MSLALFEPSSVETPPVSVPYRYSVKCDRARNAKIEAAARAAGLSVTAFVQEHFDRILDRQEPVATVYFQPPKDNRAFAERYSLSPRAVRLYGFLCKAANRAGIVALSAGDIAGGTGMCESNVGKAAAQLSEAGLITRRRRTGSPGTEYELLTATKGGGA